AVATGIAPLNFLLGFTATPAGVDALALGALTCLLARRVEPLPRAWASASVLGGAGLTVTVLCGTDIVTHPWHRVGGPLVLALGVAALILGSVAGERTPRIPTVL